MKIELIRHVCRNCMNMLALCDRVGPTVEVPILIEELDSREAKAEQYGPAVPSLVLNGEVKARGRIPDDDELTTWLRRSLDNGEDAHLELILGGAGCERYTLVKELVEEITCEHFREAELIEIGEQDQSLEAKTNGDIALMVDGTLHTFFGRMPTRDEVLSWLSN